MERNHSRRLQKAPELKVIIICFGVYYDYMFSIVDLPLYSCMDSYSPHLDHLLTWVNYKDNVSVVLILYMSGRVVDRGGDNTIESFVVHPPCSEALYCLGCFKFRP
jgi:hypothetical protein